MAARQRRRMVCPGPEDPSLLHLQTRHVSEAVWQGYPNRALRFRRWARDNDGKPPASIVPYLQQAGFYGVSRLKNIGFEGGLVSALIERWRPETHTFHLPHGECTITLEDVAVQLGLPCDGLPVIGAIDQDWIGCCVQWLGQAPPANHLKGQRLSLVWLHETFGHLNDNATEEEREQFARAYILRLIGGFLMVDHSSHFVYLMYLPLLGDLQQARQYSWGSAVLAHLYRELCNATNHQQKEIAGCQTLLHMWAWDRFPWLAPEPLPYHDPHANDYPIPPPLGIRWSGLHRSVRPPLTMQRHYRMHFDLMTEDEIVWRPYESLQMPLYYVDNSNIWRANVPLLCFHILEWHQPDRVLRQFGYDQPIPRPPADLQHAHTTKLSGKTSVNWFDRYYDFIKQWFDWQTRVSECLQPSRPLRRHSEYMQWYSRLTRRWIDPASSTSGHAANMVEAIRQMSRGRGDDLYQQRIDKYCNEILQAIGEITETLTLEQQMAPPSHEFNVPPMPEGGLRRGTRGFHAARDPIQPIKESNMGETEIPPQRDFGASSSQFTTGPGTSQYRPDQDFASYSLIPMPMTGADTSFLMSSPKYVTPLQCIPPCPSPMNLNDPPPTMENEMEGSSGMPN